MLSLTLPKLWFTNYCMSTRLSFVMGIASSSKCNLTSLNHREPLKQELLLGGIDNAWGRGRISTAHNQVEWAIFQIHIQIICGGYRMTDSARFQGLQVSVTFITGFGGIICSF